MIEIPKLFVYLTNIMLKIARNNKDENDGFVCLVYSLY